MSVVAAIERSDVVLVNIGGTCWRSEENHRLGLLVWVSCMDFHPETLENVNEFLDSGRRFWSVDKKRCGVVRVFGIAEK